MGRCRSWIATLLGLALCGCWLPARGTPVFVDSRAGLFWSGEGVLTEVSEDRRRCRVAVRDRALRVKKLWVDCRQVHPRSLDGRAAQEPTPTR